MAGGGGQRAEGGGRRAEGGGQRAQGAESGDGGRRAEGAESGEGGGGAEGAESGYIGRRQDVTNAFILSCDKFYLVLLITNQKFLYLLTDDS